GRRAAGRRDRPTARPPAAPPTPAPHPRAPPAPLPPTGAPPAAQQQQPHPQAPAVQQQQPHQQPPAAQHPPTGAPPAAQHPPTGAPPAVQHPPTGAPPAAQQQPHPQAPAAQQPAHPQPPVAQPVPAQPRPPVAQPQQPPHVIPPVAHPPQPPQVQPPAAAQPATPQQPHVPPAAATGQPTAPVGAGGFAPPPRTSEQLLEQRKQADEWRSRKVEDLRAARHEEREGNRIVIREPGRTIIQEGGHVLIRHNEVDRFGLHARDVRVEQRGSDTVTVVERPDGIRIVTFSGPDGRLLRRLRRYPDGREVIIIDNPVREYRDVASFYVDLPPPVIRIPRERYILEAERATAADVYAVLTEPPVERLERAYSLDEIRYSRPLLERMPSVDIDTIHFDTRSLSL